MPSSLVFIEHKDEINLYKEFIDADTIVVSMQPSVSVELDRMGIPYKNTLSFFGVEGHQYILSTSAMLVDKLRPFLKGVNDGEISSAFEKTWIFYFRFYFHYLLSVLFIVHKAVQEYKPDRLIVLHAKPVSKLGMQLTSSDRLLANILPLYGKAHNIKVLYVKNVVSPFRLIHLRSFFKKILGVVVFEVMLRLYHLINRRDNSQAVLIPDNSYNMPRLLNELSDHIENVLPVYLVKRDNNLIDSLKDMFKGNSFSFFTLPDFRLFSNNKTSFNKQIDVSMCNTREWLNSSPEDAIFFDVSLHHMLLDFMEYALRNGMLQLYGKIQSLKKVLNIISPKYVFSQHSIGVSHALGEYCLKKSIPGLMIPHGSYVPHFGEMADLEWSVHAHTMINSEFPFVALQTPFALNFLRQQKNVVSKGVETGPLLFAKKVNDNKMLPDERHQIFNGYKNQHVILHASSPKSWCSFRPWIYETVDEYIHNLNDVIEAVESIPDVYLAIRFRPLDNLSLSEFKNSLISSDCYGIYAEGSFEKYLLASDLLISYSSTTIEEALQNHVPVLQYDPDKKYVHVLGQMLAEAEEKDISAVYSVNSKGFLLPALQWWRDNHVYNDNEKIIDWDKYSIKGCKNMSWLSSIDPHIKYKE